MVTVIRILPTPLPRQSDGRTPAFHIFTRSVLLTTEVCYKLHLRYTSWHTQMTNAETAVYPQVRTVSVDVGQAVSALAGAETV